MPTRPPQRLHIHSKRREGITHFIWIKEEVKY